ncbi:aromatic ring-hydroxylating oxygenase subunit alpha [Pseudonocardia thermophila]|mgnify:CR=1 FL=1|uniref:aromatic ring-hydroxylating oxygenase subunit alpha n=1 Tax=Pseudonocardia thermophila TaxID=1848 RepID=UPI00248EFEA0|nr:aromatic ring-hydroxylating dioxygenase subunit alpha [Pseudonocardia thermophila]
MVEKHRTVADVPHAVVEPDRIPSVRYYSSEFYELEVRRFWPRVWQMACRLEEIPEVGDYVEYANAGQSVVVVRVDESTVKAFENACRHRGVPLVEDRGNCRTGFVCPFHGWCYDLNGRNTYVYDPSLFADRNLAADDLRLREVRLETWGGCAFVNFDKDAPSLRDSLEPFSSTMDHFNVAEMHAEWWYSIELPANWKLCMEAFMEGYHVKDTHPQLVPSAGPSPTYVPGGQRGALRPGNGARPQSSRDFIDSQLAFMRAMSIGMGGMIHQNEVRVAESLQGIELPEDPDLASQEWRKRLYDALAEWGRANRVAMPDLNALAAKGIYGGVFFGFPHFFLLPVYGSAASYRFRPLAPEKTLMEIWSLTLLPEGAKPPRLSTPVPMSADDERWPLIPKQDFSNLQMQQRGLRTRGFEFMRLSEKVEGMISNYQRLIDGYLAGYDYDVLLEASQKVSGRIDAKIADLNL